MKILLSLFLATWSLLNICQAQDPAQTVAKTGDCLVATKANNASLSQSFCIGDRITVRINDNEVIRDKITRLSQDGITMRGGREIDITDIVWIRRAMPRTEAAVVGGLLVAGGIVLFIPVLAGDVDLDAIAPQGGLSVALITAGILAARPRKFKMEKGDALQYQP